MHLLWLLVRPLLGVIMPWITQGKRAASTFFGDWLPTIVIVAALCAGVGLLANRFIQPAKPPMVLVSAVENKLRESQIVSINKANAKLEAALERRDVLEKQLRSRISQLQSEQEGTLKNATARPDSDLFSSDSEWMQRKRKRTKGR